MNFTILRIRLLAIAHAEDSTRFETMVVVHILSTLKIKGFHVCITVQKGWIDAHITRILQMIVIVSHDHTWILTRPHQHGRLLRVRHILRIILPCLLLSHLICIMLILMISWRKRFELIISFLVQILANRSKWNWFNSLVIGWPILKLLLMKWLIKIWGRLVVKIWIYSKSWQRNPISRLLRRLIVLLYPWLLS